MKTVDAQGLAKLLNDASDLRGMSILVYPHEVSRTSPTLISLDLTKLKHGEVVTGADGDSNIVPYLLAGGLEEGWLTIQIDDTDPRNKLSYLNKLINNRSRTEVERRAARRRTRQSQK